MFYIGLYEESKKNFLSETIKLRTLIFGIQHQLVDLYQVCSKYPSVAKNCPAPEGHMFDIGLFREKHGKIFLSATIMPKALILSM